LRVGFATSSQFPHGSADDQILRRAFEAAGHDVSSVVWTRASTPWATFDAIIVRSTWDYHRRPQEFLEWTRRVAASGARLFNAPSILRWNHDKQYLLRLRRRGIPILPTRRVATDRLPSVDATFRWSGADRLVVKPTISASSHRTHLVDRRQAAALWRRMRRAKPEHVLLQPFIPQIQSRGEHSIAVYGGRVSHAVRKRPAPGDFRTQEHHGGIQRRIPLLAADRRLAMRVWRAAPGPLLYARVDIIHTDDGPRLMELEAVEPDLLFRFEPKAAQRFLDAFERMVAR
jgi:glutathione synthase/RimK-type ligase-like ATP-grasp enzyme